MALSQKVNTVAVDISSPNILREGGPEPNVGCEKSGQ